MGPQDASHVSPRLRIAIAGGGIGGLALATFLRKSAAADIKVYLYEANASLTEVGAGVACWIRTWRILTQGGLAEDLQRLAPPGRDLGENKTRVFEFRQADRGKPEGRSFYTMDVPFGIFTMHRADFQQALAKHAVPPAVPHFAKKLISYSYHNRNGASSELLLHFADGSIAQADVLIGADGVRSPTRGAMFRYLDLKGELRDQKLSGENEVSVSDLVDPVWSGTNVYRCLIPVSVLESRIPGHRSTKGPVVYIGKDKHVLTYPIAQLVQGETKPMVNLVAFVSEPAREGSQYEGAWVRPAPTTDLLSTFKGWEEEVQALIELVENPLLWAIHTVKHLPTFTDAEGRVALLGDAAHAMTPHQGAGGGQAIEDAYVLAALLAHPKTTHATLPLALRAYDTVRRPEAQRVVNSSRLNGRMYELNEAWGEDGPGDPERIATYEAAAAKAYAGEDDEEIRKLRRLAANIMAIHDWEWAPVPEEDQPERAVRLFEEALAGNSTK